MPISEKNKTDKNPLASGVPTKEPSPKISVNVPMPLSTSTIQPDKPATLAFGGLPVRVAANSIITGPILSNLIEDYHQPDTLPHPKILEKNGHYYVKSIEKMIEQQEDVDIQNLAKITLPNKIHDEQDCGLSRITEYDRAVIEACFSIIASGGELLTTTTIYRAITGNATAKPGVRQKENIKACIEKCRLLDTACQQVTETGDVLQYRSYILPVSVMSIKANNGKITEAYKLLETPALYRYCYYLNNLFFASTQFSAIKDMSYTARNVSVLNVMQRELTTAIVEYQTNRNAQKKREKTFEVKIPFSTIIAACNDVSDEKGVFATGEENATQYQRVAKSRLASNTITKICKSWAERNYIVNWDFYKGQAEEKLGVTITLRTPGTVGEKLAFPVEE